MMTLARHLYRRVLTRSRLIGLSVLSAVPGGVLWLVGNASDLEVPYSEVASTTGFTIAVAALLVAVATLREERDEGTLPYIYMRPIGRPALAAASLMAGGAAAVTFAFIGWIVTLLVALLVGYPLADAVAGLALFVPAALGYAAVFVPLGYLVPRSLLAGLLYLIVGESILANFIPGLAQISVWKIANSIYAGLAPEVSATTRDVLEPLTAGAGGGLAKLAGVGLVGLAVLTWALAKRDAL